MALDRARRLDADTPAAQRGSIAKPLTDAIRERRLTRSQRHRAGGRAVELDDEHAERVGLALGALDLGGDAPRRPRSAGRRRGTARRRRAGRAPTRKGTSPAVARRSETVIARAAFGGARRGAPERARAEGDAGQDQREPARRRRGDRLVESTAP